MDKRTDERTALDAAHALNGSYDGTSDVEIEQLGDALERLGYAVEAGPAEPEFPKLSEIVRVGDEVYCSSCSTHHTVIPTKVDDVLSFAGDVRGFTYTGSIDHFLRLRLCPATVRAGDVLWFADAEREVYGTNAERCYFGRGGYEVTWAQLDAEARMLRRAPIGEAKQGDES